MVACWHNGTYQWPLSITRWVEGAAGRYSTSRARADHRHNGHGNIKSSLYDCMNKSTKLYLFECFFSVFMFYDRDRLSMPPTSILVTLVFIPAS